MAGSAGSGNARIATFFLESPSGRILATHHLPGESQALRGHVLVVPPFNEEMNRCRSMLTLQAKDFAALGYGTLVIDLHGTGDSDGEYRDARWTVWLDDIGVAHRWLMGQPGGLSAILGVRLGAILATQARAQFGAADVPLVLWQPVLDGKVHLTQFFRVRMAAQLDRPDLPKETTKSMREKLGSGEILEVAGYEIHPELADAIDGARLVDNELKVGSKILWLENAAPDKSELSVASASAVGAWVAAGASVEASTFSGPAFWQVHERAIAPGAIDQTSSWFRKQIASK
jgi:exosortase A-associated hydrolase 2